MRSAKLILIGVLLAFNTLSLGSEEEISFECSPPEEFSGNTFAASGTVEKGKRHKVPFLLFNSGRTLLEKNIPVGVVFSVENESVHMLTLEDLQEPKYDLESIVLRLVADEASSPLSKVVYKGKSFYSICRKL